MCTFVDIFLDLRSLILDSEAKVIEPLRYFRLKIHRESLGFSIASDAGKTPIRQIQTQTRFAG